MNSKKEFLVVPSKTRLELKLIEEGGDFDSVIEDLVFPDIKKDVLESHVQQKENLKYLDSIFDKKDILDDRSLLTKELASSYRYIISAGGDNHFCWVAQHSGFTPIIGFKMDDRPEKGSSGALLYFKRKGFDKELSKIANDNYELEKWTKIDAKLNSQNLEPAVSEYLFAERDIRDSSRLVIEIDGKKLYQRSSSGLLVVSGAGSTGWYNNIHKDIFGDIDHFGREERLLKAVLKETGRHDNRKFTIDEFEELKIVSYLDEEGIACPDSIKENTYDFKMGSITKVKVSDEYLNVVKVD